MVRYRIAKGYGPLKCGRVYRDGDYVPASIVTEHLLQCGTIEAVEVEPEVTKPKRRRKAEKGGK